VSVPARCDASARQVQSGKRKGDPGDLAGSPQAPAGPGWIRMQQHSGVHRNGISLLRV